MSWCTVATTRAVAFSSWSQALRCLVAGSTRGTGLDARFLVARARALVIRASFAGLVAVDARAGVGAVPGVSRVAPEARDGWIPLAMGCVPAESPPPPAMLALLPVSCAGCNVGVFCAGASSPSGARS